MDKTKEDFISMLKEGNCFVKINSVNRPFLLYTPLLERKWLSEEQIFRNNDKVIEKFMFNEEKRFLIN